MLSRASMMMTSLETLKISFALDIKLFDESVSRDIGTEGIGRSSLTPRPTIRIRYGWPKKILTVHFPSGGENVNTAGSQEPSRLPVSISMRVMVDSNCVLGSFVGSISTGNLSGLGNSSGFLGFWLTTRYVLSTSRLSCFKKKYGSSSVILCGTPVRVIGEPLIPLSPTLIPPSPPSSIMCAILIVPFQQLSV